MKKNKLNLMLSVGILNYTTAYSSVEFLQKNSLLSWFSKKFASKALEDCATAEQRLKVLKDKIDAGNLEISEIKELYGEEKITYEEMLFLSLRELHKEGKFNQLTFASLANGALKHMATENKGVVDILCEQCGIARGSDVYFTLLGHCFRNASLQGIPLVSDGEKLDLAKSLIDSFKDMANEDNGLVDILCEQCEINRGSDIYLMLLASCLTNPGLRKIPLIVADIPPYIIELIDAKNNNCTNPDPDFCRAVMESGNVEEMAHNFDTFFSDGDRKKQDPYYKSQGEVYGKGYLFKADVNRSKLCLNIGGREILLSGNFRNFNECDESHCLSLSETQRFADFLTTKEAFDRVLEELEDQGELNEQEALEVLKQIVLAYRGQNGIIPLISAITFSLSNYGLRMEPGSWFVVMSLEKQLDGCFMVTEKREIIPIREIKNKFGFVALGCRFKFPGKERIRRQLSIASTREKSEDEKIIEWNCPFCEDPPTKVIFYGGNQTLDSRDLPFSESE